jgi:predicted SnoaL-like aldol condensation-catalyzing enzyme
VDFPPWFLLQVVSDSNKRIEATVGEARRAAEQFNTGFDVAKALVNISQVAAVQQGDLAKQVALVARQVAENPDVEDAAIRKDISSLTEVRRR